MLLGTLFTLLAQCLLIEATSCLVKHDGGFVPDHVLRVSSRNISIACTSRQSAVVNGTSPGPELRVPAGQRTWIRVYNDLEQENLTMHWHGLAQRMAIFADGSPQGSQWPIPPGHFFDYELQTTVEDAGTYFYHSHVGMQALTASGALIVEGCERPPYQYDDERTLHWSDFFPQTDHEIEVGLQSVPLVWPGEVRAVLLNGKGIGIGHEADVSPSGDCSLPVIDVDPGKTYRFRFIGATGLSLVSMGFEGHQNLTIIQVDGGEWTKPASVDRIQLASGQRFDALFKAKTEEELASEGRQTYFIQFETRDRPEVYRGYAVIRYSKASTTPHVPTIPPLTLPNNTYDWLEYELRPLIETVTQPTLGEVTRRVIINASQLTDPQNQHVVWRLANLSWTEAVRQTPLLVDIYKFGDLAIPNYDAALANYGWDPETRAFPAKVGEVLEIVFQNTGSLVGSDGAVDIHPFHAHGEHFYDIGSGDGVYDAEANEAKLVAMNYTAVKRDTTMLYHYAATTTPGAPAGWRAWRLRVTQPGVWMIHCHILQHMVMGKSADAV
uniref:Ascorbate oxidase n=1 Tax=Acremonium sp. HI-25 TaxID=159120 RepID=O42702_9HYPO|nr:ascorbate oxidase [Acremonium sp. HI-25]